MPGPYVINTEGTGFVKIDDVPMLTPVNWKRSFVDPKTISAGKPGGMRGRFSSLINVAEELEIAFENMTLELWAKICGGDITTPAGARGIFGEKVGPAIAGVLPALTVIPVRTNSEVCWQVALDGTMVPCKNMGIGVPADAFEYTIVPATGVITTLAAFVGYYYVSYAGELIAAAVKYTADATDVIAAVAIQVIERAHSLMEGKEGGNVYTFPNCKLLAPPDFGSSREEAGAAMTVRYSIGGDWTVEPYEV